MTPWRGGGGEGVSGTNEKVGRGWQCSSILIDGRHNDGDGGICVSWSGPYCLTVTLLRGWAPYRLAGSTLWRRGVRVMKRLAVTSILIGGNRDEGEGVCLCWLAGAQLLDNDAAEGGRRCPALQAVR